MIYIWSYLQSIWILEGFYWSCFCFIWYTRTLIHLNRILLLIFLVCFESISLTFTKYMWSGVPSKLGKEREFLQHLKWDIMSRIIDFVLVPPIILGSTATHIIANAIRPSRVNWNWIIQILQRCPICNGKSPRQLQRRQAFLQYNLK